MHSSQLTISCQVRTNRCISDSILFLFFRCIFNVKEDFLQTVDYFHIALILFLLCMSIGSTTSKWTSTQIFEGNNLFQLRARIIHQNLVYHSMYKFHPFSFYLHIFSISGTRFFLRDPTMIGNYHQITCLMPSLCDKLVVVSRKWSPF